MKKITFIVLSLVLGSVLFATQSFAAATATFSPKTATVQNGKLFKLDIVVNPQGTTNYAEKIEVNFPADKVEVVSFTQAPNWMSLSQTSYDVTNNQTGVLIRTAGYPSGITSATTFGTIIFRAKAEGSGIITFGSGSVAYEQNGQPAILGESATFTVTAPVVVEPTPTPTPATTDGTTPVTTDEETPAVSDLETALGAQGAVATGAGINVAWYWALGVVLLALIVRGIFWYIKKRKVEQN